ncbi:MAG: hypothetical protein GXY65_01735 [Rhodococcus sp.]|uniref:hypothetical protein n=1 Tax=Rhodococcus TaxID=1827 RepID=UPI0016A2C45D|nr:MULTISPECIES: hypothetical protein [Rhodococcus]NLV78064.1 hypothetical protein [Rhodococcus sp. (in: high G+C Gram-positive bacteria)]
MNDLERAARSTLVTDTLARPAHAPGLGTLDEYGALLTDDIVWEFPGTGTMHGVGKLVHRRIGA